MNGDSKINAMIVKKTYIKQ